VFPIAAEKSSKGRGKTKFILIFTSRHVTWYCRYTAVHKKNRHNE